MPERPIELTYGLDERPPWLHLLALGFQHVAVIRPYLVMVALVVEAAKLPHDAAQSAIGLAMIAVAVQSTILQSLRVGPVGSGLSLPAGRLGDLSSVEHCGGGIVRDSAVCGMVASPACARSGCRRSSTGRESYFRRWFRVSSSWPWGWSWERSRAVCCW